MLHTRAGFFFFIYINLILFIFLLSCFWLCSASSFPSLLFREKKYLQSIDELGCFFYYYFYFLFFLPCSLLFAYCFIFILLFFFWDSLLLPQTKECAILIRVGRWALTIEQIHKTQHKRTRKGRIQQKYRTKLISARPKWKPQSPCRTNSPAMQSGPWHLVAS